MRRVRIIEMAIILALALSVTATNSVSAKAKLKGKKETVVEIAKHVFAEVSPGEEASIEGTFPLPTARGTVDCDGSLIGSVITNWEHVDTVTFKSATLGLAGDAGSCEGASVEASGFPWTLDLSPGHAAISGVQITIEGCTYSSKKFAGKATKDTALDVTLSGEFASAGCGVKAFGLTTTALAAYTTAEGGKTPIDSTIYTKCTAKHESECK